MTSQDSTSKSNRNANDSEPLAYREGFTEFLGCTIYLDSHPLIPRTETEWWVEKCIEKLKAQSSSLKAPKVLDLIAGSGCIGVAVLKHVPSAHVDFGELEKRHLLTIQRNIEVNADASRATVYQTDVFSSITDQYDYILANPPYLAESRIGRVEDSVLAHEPREALFADKDGLALIEEMIEDLRAYLKPGGQAWIEHEPEHATLIAATAAALGLKAEPHKDQYGVVRYSVILFS